jgi:phage terminase large subunit-like protein
LSVVETNAINRQIEDLQTGHRRGLVWNETEAKNAVEVFSYLKHPKGEFASREDNSFRLESWQDQLLAAPLYGWQREDGTRRFRRGYIEEPRKNGKTAFAGGIVHKGASFDQEVGAEVYCLAASRDQAKILFNDYAKGMISNEISHLYKPWERHIECYAGGGIIKALSSDAHTAHGYNPSTAIMDEVHMQKTRDLWDAMISGQASRRNPLTVGITTAGSNRASLCWDLHSELVDILNPESPVEDDAVFGYISTIDEGDDWRDPAVWWKANPNLGITVSEDYLADLCRSAERSPGLENSFRRFNLNQWTEQAVRWVSMVEYDAAGIDIDPESLIGLPCWAGLDIGDTRDLNSLTLIFRRESEFIALPFSWAPQESIDERADRDRRDVKEWITRGFIKGFPGTRTNSERLAIDVAEILERFHVQELAYDPWGANAVIERLKQDHGVPESRLVSFRQGPGNFSPVMKEFDRLLASGKFRHDKNPVLRWNAGNLAVHEDHNGNIKPSKEKSGDKIDGIVALFMALGLAINQAGNFGPVFYENNEIEVV